jgi:hypothetical protein
MRDTKISATTLGDLPLPKDADRILDSLLPGGGKWSQAMEAEKVTCLKSCPSYKFGDCGGPQDVCSDDWRRAEATPNVMKTLIHVMRNFDHYNQEDLPSLKKGSKEVSKLLGVIEDWTEHQLSGEAYSEGALLTRTHVYRERSSAAAKQKRDAVLSKGSYKCPGCKVDYLKKWGDVAKSLYQCHHIEPLAGDDGERKTLPKHLIVLCANCHQLIHSTAANLSLEKVQDLQRGNSAGGSPADPG